MIVFPKVVSVATHNHWRTQMNFLIKPAIAAATILAMHLAAAADLTVQVDDVKAAEGNIMVAVYTADGFLKKHVKASSAAADMAGNKIVFADLPEGDYAVAVYHDANSNGKMDSNLLGIPTEDYGFSNNAVGKFGPPKFDAAKVTVPATGATLRVSLK